MKLAPRGLQSDLPEDPRQRVTEWGLEPEALDEPSVSE